MIRAYTELHRIGFAHSVEVWMDDRLVGGLYGVSLGAAFFGESSFSLVPNASNVGFVTLVQALSRHGFQFIDCQVRTEHLAKFGGSEWPREQFLHALDRALATPTRTGLWNIDAFG